MECFKIVSNEFEGRLDPYFYKPEFKKLMNSLKNSKFSLKTLKEISIKITSGATPLSGGPDYTDRTSGIPFIRSGDIEEDDTIDFNHVLYIKKETHEKKLRNSHLKKNDILIAIVGATIGQVSIYNYDVEANINQAISLVRIKEEINHKYIKAFLLSNLGQKELDRIKRPVARANINLDEIGNFKILLPSKEIQDSIVALMESVYQNKFELKRKDITLEFNPYIIDKLRISFPTLESQKCYKIKSNDITTQRIDPFYYHPKFTQIIQSLKETNFEIKTLSEISKKIINGIDCREFVENGLPYIRVANIKPNRFDYSDIKYIPNQIFSKNIQLNVDDLLITRKGTYGNAVIVDEEHKNDIISSEIFRVILKKEIVNPRYVAIWLNSSAAKKIFERESTGGIMGHLSQEALKTIIIPIPPEEVQNAIVQEFDIRKEIFEDSKEDIQKFVENAKKDVEKILLGGRNVASII